VNAHYATAAAIRAALDVHLLDEARRLGSDPNWIRRRFAFVRMLVRLVHRDPQAWVLKGGMAVELRRPGLARSTRDLDLVLRPGLVHDPASAAAVHRAVVEALLDDPDGDFLIFNARQPTRLRDDAYGRPAWRLPVECRLAGKSFANVKLDVVARSEEIGGTEQRQLPDVLGFAGIPTRSVCVTDLRQQYAEKLHALTRIYESGESTRVKDLVDLYLLVEDGVPADSALADRVGLVFDARRAHAVPGELPTPPVAWHDPFAVLAAEIGLTDLSCADAHSTVAEHWRTARQAKEV
jgi:hypothetical protein